MDKMKLIYTVLVTLLLFSSCSQEEPSKGEDRSKDRRICFRSYLPSVTQSRANVIDAANFNTCHVTGFNPHDSEYVDSESGRVTELFHNVPFEKDGDKFYAKDNESCVWPDAESMLHFLAYYPSDTVMKVHGGDGTFNLVNRSKMDGDAFNIDYKFEKFWISSDISKQVDFITAYKSAKLEESVGDGLMLNFKHQLARVELEVWGANDKYNFEMAGVKLGNAVTKATFDFSSIIKESTDRTSPWIPEENPREAVSYIFSEGDKVVKLNKASGLHTSENDAVSIMGKGGAAMVIPDPSRIEAWEGKSHSHIDKMYFSVLLRVKNLDDEIVYPYPNDKDGMNVIYFAVNTKNEEDEIIGRLYKLDGEFYTTSEKSDGSRFVSGENEEIRGFGWAALPVPSNWEAGKIYTYKLDYSKGIGWHDPGDPNPGEPIIERGKIPFGIEIDEWLPAENFQSGIEVPKR